MVCSLILIYFDAFNLTYNKNKLNKTFGYYLWFFRKGSANSFFITFKKNLSRKIFFILYSFNRPNFMFWLPLLLEILGNMLFPLFVDVIKLEINLILLIKPFFYITKKLRQKLKYLENGWNKSIFHHFWSAFRC